MIPDNPNALIVVTGAGGFVGGWMVRQLLHRGCSRIRAVDLKPLDEWFQLSPDAENIVADLRQIESCHSACSNAAYVFNFAADMGGMGFIESHKADCMLSVLINTHMLLAARQAKVLRYFFSSSACVYAAERQMSAKVTPLREEHAYPAMPEDGYGYGWEKLFSERMCRHFHQDFGLSVRIARLHNVYGPFGTYDGGREKAPAAICRKVIESKLSGRHEIEVWGDGEQTRSFMYINDCLDGAFLIMESDIAEPINLGSSQLVTINRLVDIVEDVANIKLKRCYKLDAPKGVRGRNSDNTLIRCLLGWEPPTRLEDGIEATYRWIYDQMTKPAATRNLYRRFA